MRKVEKPISINYCRATLPANAFNKDQGYVVGHLLPVIYESYCKVFHPFEFTNELSSDPVPLEERDFIMTYYGGGYGFLKNREDGKSFTDFRSEWETYFKTYSSREWHPVKWKDLTARFDLQYHNQLSIISFVARFFKIGCPPNLNLPLTGYLPRYLFLRMLEILRSQSADKEMYIEQSPPHSVKNHYDEGLMIAEWDELPVYFEKDFVGYLDALDKSWSVFTDTDLSFTMVGGSRHLINQLLNDNEIEAIECDVNTRIDVYSDSLNYVVTDKDSDWVIRL